MTPSLRALSAGVAAVLVLLGPAAGAADGATTGLGTTAGVGTADVWGDDVEDRYVAVGGLILPPTVDSGVRRDAADCPGCRWRFATPCLLPEGTPFPGSAPCTSVTRGCPRGDEFLRLWRQRPGEDWREVRLLCLAPGGPVTVDALAEGARARLVRALPALRPGAEPEQGVLARVPVAFRSGQERGPLTWSWDLAGEAVTAVATPTWTWLFGDGTRVLSDDPGGRYPDLSVAHAYRRAGVVTVRVLTTWRATVRVGPLGPFDVPEPVRQEAGLRLVIGEGRAVLVPGADRR